jgi:hypothetical protein
MILKFYVIIEFGLTCKVHAYQPSHLTQLRVTKDALIDAWHVSKIYKHVFNYESSHTSKNQPSLAQLIGVPNLGEA